MRVTSALLLSLPALALAQDQKPMGVFGMDFEPYFEKAKSYIPASMYSPAASASAKVAAKNVHVLTKDNYVDMLKPSVSAAAGSGPDNWMVLVSGGNKTCLGRCDGVDRAWNESATVFAAAPTAPKLGYIDCDQEAILCSAWMAGPAAVWYIELPVTAADQSKPATTIHTITLNTTTTTVSDIVEIHTKKGYEQGRLVDGAFHPFDGWLAQFGLAIPLGYVLYAFSVVPSWAFMIGISFISRNVM